MRNLLLVLPLCFGLSSCSKEGPVAENKEPPMPERKEFPTLPEKALKGIARTNLDSPNPTEGQLARRTRNIAIVKKMGLPTIDHLPVVEDDAVVKLRSPAEVARRCLATTVCAVKGETKDQEFVDGLIKEYSASSFFSTEERAFVKKVKPTQQELVDFSWRYECVHVFLWALKARAELVKPNEICPVSDDMKSIKKAGAANFVPKAQLRSTSEILDMADLYYRLHWAAIENRIKGKKSEKIDEGIIRERHRALNWLIRYLNQDWDDVTTDT